MEKTRAIICGIGLDAHTRGMLLIANTLRDAGMEVLFLGPWQNIPNLVKTALEESVDVIGISTMGYDHVLVPQLTAELKKAGIGHVQVVVGGIVPHDWAQALKDAGVSRVFPPGSKLNEIVAYISEIGRQAKKATEISTGGR